MAMRTAPRWAVASLILALVALAGLVGIGARQLPGGEVRPPPFLFRVDTANLVTWVFLVLVAAGAALLLYAVLTGPRRQGGGPRKRTSPIAILAALVVVAAVIMFGPIDRIREALGSIIPDEGAAAVGGSGVAQVGIAGPTGSVWWVAVLVGVVALAALAVTAIVRQRSRPGDLVGVATDEIVQGAVAEALVALRLGDDPRSAVLRAYVAMEQSLAEAGWGRRTWEAPGEYLSRVAPRLGSGTTAGLTLTRVFEAARFGRHPVSDMDRTAAEEALTEVLARVVQPS